MSRRFRYVLLVLAVAPTSLLVGALQRAGDWSSGTLALATVGMLALGGALAARLGLLESPPEHRHR